MNHRLLVLLLTGAMLLTGCTSGAGGDGAGAAIVGQPIGGADNALPFARISLNAVDVFAVSDLSGQYIIPGIPAGTYTLRVAKWNTPLVTLPITIDPQQPVIDLGRLVQSEPALITVTWPALPAGFNRLAGRVVDAEGRGIAGVEVVLAYASGALARTVTMDGDPDTETGHFSFNQLPDAPIRLIIGQDGFRPSVTETPFQEFPLVEGVHQTGEIELRSLLPAEADPAVLTVRVTGPDGGVLSGIPVLLSLIDPERPPMDRFSIGGISNTAGEWTFPGVPGGQAYQVWAAGGNWRPETATVTLEAGEARTVTLQMRPLNGRHPYIPAP